VSEEPHAEPAEEPGRPYGTPGRPLRRGSPFYLGFVGAVGVLVAYFLVQAVLQARSVLILIVVALFLAVGLNPIVETLMRRGMRRGLAITAVFVAVIAVFVGFAATIVPPLVSQTNDFVQMVPDYLDNLEQNERIQRLNDDYGFIDNVQSYIASGDIGERLFGGILGVGRIVLNAVFSALTVLFLTLYFLAALPSITAQAYRLVPASRRHRVKLLGDEILRRIGGYVNGAIVVGTLAGLTSYVFLLVVGLPYALPLAIFAGFMSLVPMVGATIAAVVVSTIGLFQSVAVAIACVVFYIVYQQIENYVIYPRVMKRSVDVPAAVTVIAALVGGALLGVVGALLAIPTAAGLLLVVREVLVPRLERL
jgi:predicted PurR-regulated permease PerM